MADGCYRKGKLTEKKVSDLIRELIHKARRLRADRIIITPLETGDNITFITPAAGRGYQTATTTETWWREIVAKMKYDAGLDFGNCQTCQEGEVVYCVSGMGVDNRVFVSIKTEHPNDGGEKVRLLIA